jgi:kynurenine/2-aminoadipate aminotransferase
VKHQVTEFKPLLPKDKWTCIVTTGSQDGLAKAFEALVDETDTVLLENPTYPGALSALRPYGPEILSVETDNQGIIPDQLEKVLQDRKLSGKKMPKFIYTIPHYSNPSGASLTQKRKEGIYKLACEYNFLILEDDPYYFLSFGEKHTSFLNLDSEGRVLRFDSLSKVLSSGLRVGWCTGPNEIMERINYAMQSTSLHTSAMSQTICVSLLKKWGREGFDKHITQTQEFYKQKRDEFCSLADKHLKGLAEWSVPQGGMFVWFKLLNCKDSKEVIEKKAVDKLVLLVPGQAFHPLDQPGPYCRASYSIESKENFEKGLIRLADLLKDLKE